MNSYIGLKFGNLKCWNLTKDFCEKNKELVNKLNEFWDKSTQGCYCMFAIEEKNRNEDNIKLELINLLDKFFDVGVKIYNDFDNKTYKTKKSYKDYILNYGKGE